MPGNPFHFNGIHRVTDATFHPDWTVSGPEFQRAWEAATDTKIDNVVAIDLPAYLPICLNVTGLIQAEGYGTVTGGNLGELLAGSYDKSEDSAARHRLNNQLAGVFRDRLLASGQFVAKGKVLGDAARGRHLAFWSADARVQDAFAGIGMSGGLGDASHDYLGVFTQNRNGAKSDYWQKRALSSTVRLHEDGSARVEVRVRIHNDSPPYARSDVDPGTGYWTRYNTVDVLQMLPKGAVLRKLVTPGNDVMATRTWAERPFYRRRVPMDPGATAELLAVYDVPAAATVSGDRMTYRLAYDPQGLVTPQALRVRLVYPNGWSTDDLPQGWAADEDGATLDAGRLDSTGVWSIDLKR